MPVYEGSHETVLPASAETAFAVMTDYESLPDWQGALAACRVRSRHADGLASEVEYEVDAKLRRVRYVLRHTYEPPLRIGSEYVEGDFECFGGSWTFAPDGEKTRARLALRIDPGLPIPGRLQRMLSERVLKSSVEDLRKRLEDG